MDAAHGADPSCEEEKADPPVAIRIARLSVSYPSPHPGGDPVPGLCGVDLEVVDGATVALMGPVGAGKSTLCLALNGAIPQAVDCTYQGQVIVGGLDAQATPMAQLALQIGLVFENAEDQLFSATVMDEVAFGLESMGLAPHEIERRAAEALHLVDLTGYEERSPRTLSGGQQKRLALASVLAMRPRVLVLDEPTAGLDARGRNEVLSAIERLRADDDRETTVIMATQDAEAAARFADRIVVLNDGEIALDGSPTEVFGQVERLATWGLAVPQLARVAHRFHLPIAFAPHEAARLWTSAIAQPAAGVAPPRTTPPAEPLATLRDVYYTYTDAEPALHGVSLDIYHGEWLAVIGINGSGKTTLLKHLNGLLRPTSGAVRIEGRETHGQQVGELAHTVSYLPQNPDDSIFCATVREEVGYGPRQIGLRGTALSARVDESLALMHLLPFADHPPAVLGYGLRRQVALASVLSMHARLLALDEPTVGLDQRVIARSMEAVAAQHRRGTTIVMITHDLELVARYAERVVVLSEGRIRAQGAPQTVLADVALLDSVGLEPLPLTALAHALDWSAPLPVDLRGWEEK
ncbi:MAG: ATP-binding cassette domain-containing protein [Anaerolineae bacterium]|nr:ATP-binding cassette domain-containing protein [Anaerolineae bacterium]